MDNYRHTIISSAPAKEIQAYLKSISGITTGHIYSSDGWGVKIEKIWVERIGSLSFQRTEVTFYGREDFVNHQLMAFRLKFLSAGG